MTKHPSIQAGNAPTNTPRGASSGGGVSGLELKGLLDYYMERSDYHSHLYMFGPKAKREYHREQEHIFNLLICNTTDALAKRL